MSQTSTSSSKRKEIYGHQRLHPSGNRLFPITLLSSLPQIQSESVATFLTLGFRGGGFQVELNFETY